MEMKPCYTIEEIGKMPVEMPDNLNRIFTTIRPLLENVRQFIPQAEIRFEIAEGSYDKTRRFLGHSYIVFVRNEYLFRIKRGQWNDRVSYDIDVDISDLPSIDWRSVHDARAKLTRPDPLLKLSAAGIENWITYLTKLRFALEIISKVNYKTKNDTLTIINSLDGINWGDDMQSGHIHRNGLCYSFKIKEAGIEEKISVSMSSKTIRDFLLMTDNKYTG